VEPAKETYDVSERIFFTATQATGGTGQPIARYEWEFGDPRGSTAVGRSVSHAYNVAGSYSVTLVTTESVTGAVSTCGKDISVQ
jgi:PKD repeat protein